MIGKTISHYKILEQLGEGGMGIVYKAQDLRLDRFVAIKVLPPHMSKDEESKQRFVHEAKAASALNHPNIGVIYEIDETPDKQTFIVMAYYEAKTLREIIDEGMTDVDEVIDIALQVSSGLEAAHKKGIIHRDIKPSNILVTKDGLVEIIDFGIAKLAGNVKLTKAGIAMGTIEYMSPEQARGEEVDHQSDIFSLGSILYELLSGTNPFRGDHEAAICYEVVHEEQEPIGNIRPQVPKGLQQIVAKMLKKEQKDRYQNADDIITDLKRHKTDFGIESPPKARRRIYSLVRVAGILAVAIIIAHVLYSRWQGSEDIERKVEIVPAPEDEFVIIVAPFFGSSQEAIEEGQVMKALVERKVLDISENQSGISVVNDAIGESVRTHEQAKRLGEEHNASIVIWGEVYVLRDEVEVQPYVTYLESYQRIRRKNADALNVSVASPDQLSIRKMKANEISNIALLLAGAYYEYSDPEKALSLLEQIDPPFIEALHLEALIYNQQEKTEEAINALFIAIQLDSTDSYSHNLLGFMYYVMRDDQKTEHEFKRAIEYDPSSIFPVIYLGILYYDWGRFDEAFALLNKASKMVDNNSYMDNLIVGSALYYLGKYHEAIGYYMRASELEPDAGRTLSEIGKVYSALCDYQKAMIWLRKALDTKYRPGYVKNIIGGMYVGLGELERAAEMYRQSIEADTTLFYPYGNLGNVLVLMERYDDAIKYIEKASEFNNSSLYTYLYYSIALHGAGKKSEALDYMSSIADSISGDDHLAEIIRYYAGYATEEAVLEKSMSDIGEARKLKQCEAYYYIGMAYLFNIPPSLHGTEPDTTRAVECFSKCVQAGVCRFVEHRYATAQLDRLKMPMN